MKRIEKITIDKLDKKIIKLLQKNARQSFRDIARKLRISIATVTKRVKILEKGGVIRGYSALVSQDKIGYDIKIIIDMRISKGKLFEVEKKIASHPNVQAIYDITGPFDATIIANFKSRAEMDVFIKEIQTYDFVERTETKLVLNIVKEDVLKVSETD